MQLQKNSRIIYENSFGYAYSHLDFQDDERLPSKARNILTNSETELFYSSASIWEAQIKHIKKSEEFSLSSELLNDLSIRSGLKCLTVQPKHAIALKTLSYSPDAPRKHKDPFYRILICQAKSENMHFLTHDSLIPYYNEPCVILA